MSLLVMGANHRLKEGNHLSSWTARHCKCSICTSNASDKLRYRIIKSMHVGVELLYDHRRARDRGAT